MTAYLDNSATTRPSDGVIAAMALSMRDGYFNPSSLYAPAVEAEKAMRACREIIARAIGAQPENVYFTSGGTEANNLAILGSMAARRGPVRAIVSATEHPSVLAAYDELRALGHEVTVLPVDREGQLDWDALDVELSKGAALVSAMQVNNETGALLDVTRLVSRVRALAPDALVHVDGVQGFLRVPFSMRGVDFYTLSGHKLHAPKGVGTLVMGTNTRIKPRQLGGGQEKGLRSGTENTPGIAGLHRAIDEMQSLGDVQAILRGKKLRLWTAIREAAPQAVVFGPSPEGGAPHILNVGFPGVRGEVMLHALEGDGVYVSTGSACSSKKRKVSPVLLAMGIPADAAECAIRFSLSPMTTEVEIDYAAERAGAHYAVLSKFWRR
jgi:cysteine desulfurase